MGVKVVNRGGVALWSEGLGDRARPTLLLIMGANASAMTWPDELVRLWVDGGLHVVRYDHRDTGRSTRCDFDAAPYSIADMAEDAVAVLDGWGIEAAHVLGMSLGGTIGQLLALDHRERLRSLTVMLTAALDVDFAGNIERAFTGEANPDGLPSPRRDVLEALARRAELAADRSAELERRVAEWRLLAGSRLPFDPDEFRRWEEREIDHAGVLARPANHARANPVPLARGQELRGVTTPTLVIQGMEDPLNPPPHGKHLAGLIPTARLVEIEGLGHALPGVLHRRIAAEVLAHVRQATDR